MKKIGSLATGVKKTESEFCGIFLLKLVLWPSPDLSILTILHFAAISRAIFIFS